MNDEYISLTQLGKIFGVSRVEAGRALKKMGLRNDEGFPTETANDFGYVQKKNSTQPGTWYYCWNRRLTVNDLMKEGYQPLV